jgi:hypothetical protein
LALRDDASLCCLLDGNVVIVSHRRNMTRFQATTGQLQTTFRAD